MNNYIGADEVGVGDYFGGIVTCAVFLDEKTNAKLENLNIRDSKKISNKQIIALAKQIIPLVYYEVTDISAKEYNLLFNKYKNAHIIKTFAHDSAILRLQEKMHETGFITILDQYASKEKYEEYLTKLDTKKHAKIDKFITKAESQSKAVALASIIARYYFLKQIAKLIKRYNVNLPLGYNKPLIDVAINQLRKKLGNKFEDEKINLLKMHFKYN